MTYNDKPSSFSLLFLVDKVPLKRKLTNYMSDFKYIERLIFDVIPSLPNVKNF